MSRRGFTLVEILISVVIFSGVILGLAGLAFQIARRSTRATHEALVAAALVSGVDHVTVVPYESLATLAGRCDSARSGAVTVRTCYRATTPAARLTDVTVLVSTSVPGSQPDSIIFRRGKGGRAIPLR
jgi:prepilin-type N-terminal cleavage/methylation domain-containing protein